MYHGCYKTINLCKQLISSNQTVLAITANTFMSMLERGRAPLLLNSKTFLIILEVLFFNDQSVLPYDFCVLPLQWLLISNLATPTSTKYSFLYSQEQIILYLANTHEIIFKLLLELCHIISEIDPNTIPLCGKAGFIVSNRKP